MKIAVNSKRPIPWRADSIGPWLNALGFLSWLGSITSAALVFLFNRSQEQDGPDGSPWDIPGWALLLSILFAEHAYLAVQFVVRGVISKLDSPGLRKERGERFALRKRLFESMAQRDGGEEADGSGVSGAEKITREVLEEDARRLSVAGLGTPEQMWVAPRLRAWLRRSSADDVRRFWLRQRGAAETIQVGRALIEEVSSIHVVAWRVVGP